FSPRIAAAWNPDFGDGFFGRHLFGGKNTVIRGGYGRIYGRLNGVDLVLVPLLGTGLIQPVQCFNPTATGGAPSCGQQGVNASNAFRIGTNGLTAPIAPASATLPQPDFPGISICNAPTAGAVCPEAGASEGFDPHFRPNSVDSFTLSIQRQIGQRNTIEIGYIGRLIHNEYMPINTNAVPYMFTLGGQQFQTAYANIEKQMGCATSAAACYNADPTITPTPQPFFEAALGGANSGYCKGYASCTAAVYANEFGNLQSQNVWSLWSDLDNHTATADPTNGFCPTLAKGTPCTQFIFAPTMQQNTNQLSSGLGLNASVGYGNYHAGFVSWRMNNWHGLTSQSNFTWGKALGTNSEVQASSELTLDDPYNVSRNYGLQPFDRKFVFNSFLVYESPFFKGQRGILGRLLGGWNIAPILSMGSGFDEGCVATLGGTTAQAFGSADGVDYFDTEQCVPIGPIPVEARHLGVTSGPDAAGNQIANQNFSGANVQYNAFANPLAVWNNVRPAILGLDNGHDSGTGLLRGMPFWNVDLSVKKNFRITERFSTTFSTVFTNLFNHDQFSDGTIDLSNPGCLGVLTAGCSASGATQISNPRQIELSLRINF
ncbi:MAG TPA: hypothetical protein VE998_12245, partial [Terriglobales bacterium]|nr:hypothetical protein [Terriglobales bacterium]